MTDLLSGVGAFIDEKKLIEPGAILCVAISGGSDSTALLNILRRLRQRFNFALTACHVDYRYRTSSGADARFAAQLAQSAAIPFRLFTNNAPKPPTGLQEEARTIRYRFFEELMAEGFCDAVATGHTLDDSVETSLLWMIRGTGPGAFGGIRPRRGRYIRPLLALRKDELVQWLTTENIAYRTDASNDTDAYRRNRLRRRVIPLLEEESPGALRAIARLTELCRAQNDFIETLAQKRVAEWTEQGRGSLRHAAVAREPIAFRYALYRAACAAAGLAATTVSHERIEALDKAMMAFRAGKRIELPHNFEALYDQGGMIIRPAVVVQPITPVPFRVSLVISTAAGRLTIGKGETFFDASALPEGAVMRSRRPGDFITLGGGGRKSLKTFFIDKKVPFHVRDQWPVIAVGERIFYVAGLYINPVLTHDEPTCALMWERGVEGIRGSIG